MTETCCMTVLKDNLPSVIIKTHNMPKVSGVTEIFNTTVVKLNLPRVITVSRVTRGIDG